MIRLIRFLITGSLHEHTWIEVEDFNTAVWWGGKKEGELPDCFIRTYLQKCSECGKMKVFKFKTKP